MGGGKPLGRTWSTPIPLAQHTLLFQPTSTALMASLPPPALQNAGRWLRAKGNVNFPLLIGLTGSASLPAAQILEHVSYAWQHLQKNCCPFSVAGKQRENVPEEWMLLAESSKAQSLWNKVCLLVLFKEATLNLLRPILVSRDRMRPKAKTGN